MPQDYEFEVTITAVVRVRAENEASARDVSLISVLNFKSIAPTPIVH